MLPDLRLAIRSLLRRPGFTGFVAMAACFVPARQAARLDPTLALKSDS
jgi:ABC-type lipoprotein release transport system permease subunit